MPFLVCWKCQCSCSIDTHTNKLRPMYCGPDAEGNMIACEWLEPPERIEKRRELYDDPIGENYKPKVDNRIIYVD